MYTVVFGQSAFEHVDWVKKERVQVNVMEFMEWMGTISMVTRAINTLSLFYAEQGGSTGFTRWDLSISFSLVVQDKGDGNETTEESSAQGSPLGLRRLGVKTRYERINM